MRGAASLRVPNSGDKALRRRHRRRSNAGRSVSGLVDVCSPRNEASSGAAIAQGAIARALTIWFEHL